MAGTPSSLEGKRLALIRAAMCEEMKDTVPPNVGVCFPVSIGKISCFTAFESTSEKTVIYHKWFHRDKLSTNKKILVRGPRSSGFTTILLREADKGPWRVDVTDEKGNLFAVMRFSIID